MTQRPKPRQIPIWACGRSPPDWTPREIQLMERLKPLIRKDNVTAMMEATP
jgi:hypothetical protein